MKGLGKPVEPIQQQPPKGTIQGVEGLVDMNVDPRGSVKQIIANQKQLQAESDSREKKRKLILPIAIGVGVVSIFALIYLLRRK
jgi:hypothetical protein